MKRSDTNRNKKPQTFPDFLDMPVDEVAKRLLGCVLEREIEGQKITVRIVETESYDQEDEASHAYGGERKRNSVMFGEPGRLYVYFTYGMHYCCNVVTGQAGYGSGVLIRAAEPIGGIGLLERLRGRTGVDATNGPAKLCQALDIDMELSGHDLRKRPLKLYAGGLKKGEIVVSSPRIGISKAKDIHRRFYVTNNPFVSGIRKSVVNK